MSSTVATHRGVGDCVSRKYANVRAANPDRVQHAHASVPQRALRAAVSCRAPHPCRAKQSGQQHCIWTVEVRHAWHWEHVLGQRPCEHIPTQLRDRHVRLDIHAACETRATDTMRHREPSHGVQLPPPHTHTHMATHVHERLAVLDRDTVSPVHVIITADPGHMTRWARRPPSVTTASQRTTRARAGLVRSRTEAAQATACEPTTLLASTCPSGRSGRGGAPWRWDQRPVE